MLAVLVFVGSLDEGEIWADDHSHIVVIPDVHGDVDALLRSLWLAQKKIEPDRVVEFSDFMRGFQAVMDSVGFASDSASAHRPSVVVVQLGDLVDRGPHSTGCVIMMGLVPRVLGWRVVRLYGNHEIMSFLHVADQFVHPEDFALFGDRAARQAALSPNGYLFESIASNFIGVARLSPNPDKPVPGRNPASLFVHGGIDLAWLFGELEVISDDIDDVNKEIERAVRSGRIPVLNEPDSILWTRDLAQLDEHEICGAALGQILAHFQVARIIVGHTPQEDGIAKSRCGGRIILADVMMSRWMTREFVDEKGLLGGNPVALILTVDPQTQELESIVAHHTDLRTGTMDTETWLFPPLPDVDDVQPPFSTELLDNNYFLPWLEDPDQMLGIVGDDDFLLPWQDNGDQMLGNVGVHDGQQPLDPWDLPAEATAPNVLPDDFLASWDMPAGEVVYVGSPHMLFDEPILPLLPEPAQGASVFVSNEVRIVEATLGPFEGVMTIFPHPGLDANLLARLESIPLLPRLVDRGALSQDSRYLFLETSCTFTLQDWRLTGNVVTESMMTQLVDTVQAMHAHHILLGVESWDHAFSLFATDGGTVHLINWVSLTIGGHKEIAAEAALVATAVPSAPEPFGLV